MSVRPLSMRQNIRLLPRPLWVLYAGTFINRFGSFVAVFLVLYLTRRGYSPAQAGLGVAAFGAGAIPASAVSGFLADRLGRRETIILASVLAAGFTMALALVNNLPLLILLAGLTGLSNQMFRAPSAALLADLVPEERRMAAVGIMRLAINAGFAAGPAAAGFLADRSFVLLFAGDAATSLVFGAIALAWLPRGAPRSNVPRVRAEGMRSIAADRTFLAFLLATTAVSAVYAQTATAFPLWIHDNHFSNATYGALVGLNGGIIVVIELFLIAYLQRFRPKPVIVAGYLLIGLGFTATIGARTIPLLALTVLVWTAGEMLSFPASGVLVANASPRHLRGRYQGAWGMSWAIGWTVGPSVGSWIYQRNTTVLWLICGAVGLLAAAMVAVLPDRGERSRLGEDGAQVVGRQADVQPALDDLVPDDPVRP
ncbi:MAG TPA: MFS transporter [Candidatus Dormibacteraeota bacterium]